ncbi:hypothetical protein C3B44_09590 [Corynebacterium yudongzhengii]|uniref:DoxX family membrane protein n=1 Tax=Corynebacterium yudongzhengii TaxID=2080740 RepID=A0A2U1T920_9CORY|nr:MauE/DoxX family redox-associated membrane protein [Corynebacterium yudongzhengii]AWB83033.1 hypothetical protein C3B44_09590 [Corynebacterium yudongzhengii]PWC02514.1 DoxX family membrane protein [Corynebacterium yudongzhengii]
MTETSRATGRSNVTIALDIVSFVARFYMAFIWIAAGLSKVGQTMTVSQTIAAYEIFTPEFSYLLAQLIGPLEIGGGLLLLFGVFLRQSAAVSLGVLVLFILGLSWAWANGLEISCGCFGGEDATNIPVTIVRDIGYVALSVWAIWRPYRRFAVHP